MPGGASGVQVEERDNGGGKMLGGFRGTAGVGYAVELGGVFFHYTWGIVARPHHPLTGRGRAFRGGGRGVGGVCGPGGRGV